MWYLEKPRFKHHYLKLFACFKLGLASYLRNFPFFLTSSRLKHILLRRDGLCSPVTMFLIVFSSVMSVEIYSAGMVIFFSKMNFRKKRVGLKVFVFCLTSETNISHFSSWAPIQFTSFGEVANKAGSSRTTKVLKSSTSFSKKWRG